MTQHIFALCEGWWPSCQYELLSDGHSWGVFIPHFFQTSDIADCLRQDLCVWFNENKLFKTKTLPWYRVWLIIQNMHSVQNLWVRLKIKRKKKKNRCSTLQFWLSSIFLLIKSSTWRTVASPDTRTYFLSRGLRMKI